MVEAREIGSKRTGGEVGEEGEPESGEESERREGEVDDDDGEEDREGDSGGDADGEGMIGFRMLRVSRLL